MPRLPTQNLLRLRSRPGPGRPRLLRHIHRSRQDSRKTAQNHPTKQKNRRRFTRAKHPKKPYNLRRAEPTHAATGRIYEQRARVHELGRKLIREFPACIGQWLRSGLLLLCARGTAHRRKMNGCGPGLIRADQPRRSLRLRASRQRLGFPVS